MSKKGLRNKSNSEELFSYLQEKAENHRCYKHYVSSKETVESILKNHAIVLSNGDSWNDPTDKNNFNAEDSDKVRFGICFSYMISESVAMWVLYGKKEGYMIDFPRKIIRECKQAAKVYLGNITKDGEFHTVDVLGKDAFEIDLFDIVYFGDSKEKNTHMKYLKRSDEGHSGFPTQELQKLCYVKKTMPWSFECECRLVVSVSKNKIPENVDRVLLEFDRAMIELLKTRIYRSPNLAVGDYNKSKLYGKINW